MKMTKKMIERESMQMFNQCIKDATAKEDGKNHEVQVILSDFRDPFYGRWQWLSGCIDDRREYGGKLGLGSQTVLHKCIVYAPKKEIAGMQLSNISMRT